MQEWEGISFTIDQLMTIDVDADLLACHMAKGNVWAHGITHT